MIGAGEKEMFISSDVSALLNHTRKIIYLDENELAVITDKSYAIKTLSARFAPDGSSEASKKLDKKVHNINLNLEEIEKGGFKHFMLKEIFQQPEAVGNTLRGRMRKKQN